MAPKADNRTLPPKEAALFRQLAKQYEVRMQALQAGAGGSARAGIGARVFFAAIGDVLVPAAASRLSPPA